LLQEKRFAESGYQGSPEKILSARGVADPSVVIAEYVTRQKNTDMYNHHSEKNHAAISDVFHQCPIFGFVPISRPAGVCLELHQNYTDLWRRVLQMGAWESGRVYSREGV